MTEILFASSAFAHSFPIPALTKSLSELMSGGLSFTLPAYDG